jgi:hypothetical protein
MLRQTQIGDGEERVGGACGLPLAPKEGGAEFCFLSLAVRRLSLIDFDFYFFILIILIIVL